MVHCENRDYETGVTRVKYGRNINYGKINYATRIVHVGFGVKVNYSVRIMCVYFK